MTKSEALNKCTHYFWTWLFISEVSMTNIISEKILCELTSFWSCLWWIHGTPIVYEKSFRSVRFLYIQSYCLEWKFALEDSRKYLFSKMNSPCSLRLAVEQFSSSCSVRLADSELEKIKMSKICLELFVGISTYWLSGWLPPSFSLLSVIICQSVEWELVDVNNITLLCQSQY